MPYVTVDANDTKLFYIDSGVPAHGSSSYCTIIAIHGIHFNGGQYFPNSVVH